MTCLILIASFIVISDRIAKFLIINNLFQGQSIEIIPRILHLTLVFNTGTLFGLFRDKNKFFIVASLLAIALIFLYVYLARPKPFAILSALGLILGGAIGNMTDRVIFGYIIDFLDFRIWPVFNIADASITIGVGILILTLLFKRRCCTQ